MYAGLLHIETKGTNGSRLILLDKIYRYVARAGESVEKEGLSQFLCATSSEILQSSI